MREYILAINPGSTSTKVAIFKGEENIKEYKIQHSIEEIEKFDKVSDQYSYRLKLIYEWLRREKIDTNMLLAVVGRGGLLRPMPGGTYLVTEKMIDDLKIGIRGEHAANLGGMLAKGIGDKEGIKSYIADPVAVDEFEDIARISGLAEIERISLVHALNIKMVSYRRADEIGKKIEDVNFVVAHMGGGISVAPFKHGKIVDANNASEMGPFSSERTGGLPVGDLVDMCYSKKYTLKEMKLKIKGKGGLVSYLNTNDGKKVEEMIKKGDKKAELVYSALAYQVGKEIGAMATVLNGKVDSIILTGGFAYSKFLVEIITSMVKFIGEVVVYPGEDEMRALNQGVLRVLKGIEKEKIYEDEVDF